MSRKPNTTTAPTGSIAPFGLRMLPELKAKLEEAATASGRSMNAEVVSRLESSFTQLQGGSSELVDAQRKTIQAQETNLLVLQTYLIDVINSLPSKYRTDERVRMASSFLLGTDAGDALPIGQVQLPLVVVPSPKKIEVSVRGKLGTFEQGDGFVADPSMPPLKKVRSVKSANKVIIVGNIGMDAAIDRYSRIVQERMPMGEHVPPQPPNKGPERSKNARKPKGE